MSQGIFPDLLIRFEAFKRIFLFCQKIDFLPRNKPTFLGQKRVNFQVDIFNFFLCP